MNDKCSAFVCKYIFTCLVGIECENGNAPRCRLNYCEICKMNKSCPCRRKGKNMKNILNIKLSI